MLAIRTKKVNISIQPNRNADIGSKAISYLQRLAEKALFPLQEVAALVVVKTDINLWVGHG